MWALFLVLVASARAATILSQFDDVVLLNGQQQHVSKVTVAFGPSDEGVPFNLEITNPQTQQVSNLQFVSQAPQYVYTHQLTGWIPRTIYPFKFSSCLSPTAPYNISMLSQPSVLNNNVNSGSPFAVVQSFVSRASKRFHSFSDSYHKLPPVFRLPRRKANSTTRSRSALSNRQRQKRQKTVNKSALPTNKRILARPGVVRALQPYNPKPVKATGTNPNSAKGWGTDYACTYGIGEIFGICGSGGIQHIINAVNALQTEVSQQQNEIISVANTIEIQQQWQNQEQQTTNLLVQADATISSQINSLLQDAQINARDIQALSQVTFSFIAQTDSDFQQVSNQITGLSVGEQAIYNYTNALQNVTQNQINALISTINADEISAMQQIMMQYAIYAKTQTRRTLIALLWADVVNAPTPIPSCLFVQCLGSPNLPVNGTPTAFQNAGNCPADPPGSCSYLLNKVPVTNLLNTATNPPTPQNQQDLHNLYSAGMLSMVRLQYTDASSGIAYERQISYNCDKLFLLNNYIPNINFKYLLRFMGPPNNGSQYCYDTANPGSATWSCNCVVVETYTSCSLLTGAPIFPFGWDQTRVLLDSPQAPQYCIGGTVQPSGLSGENLGIPAAVTSTGMVLSSTSNWYDFMTALCQSSSTWAADANGNKVRIASDTSTGFIDLALNANLISDMCESDVSVLAQLSDNQYRLSYNVYSAWAIGYQVVNAALLSYWEQQVFGTMPTGVRTHEGIFNDRPDIQQSISCTTAYVSKYAGTGIGLELDYSTTLSNQGFNPNPNLLNPQLVTNGDEYPPYPDFSVSSLAINSTEKLPLYSISPVQLTYSPYLTINGGQCVVVNGSCTLPLNGLNFSVATDIQLTSQWSNMLPGPTFWVGDFNLGYNANGDQVVVDAPRDLLKIAKTRESLCNSLLYLFQPRQSVYANNTQFNIPDTDYDIPVNALDWASFYNSFYDPSCATESAYSYARRVDQYGICQESVDDTGTPTNSIPGNNDYCGLMEAYRVYVPNYVSAYMILEPREYVAEATFVVPTGPIVQQINTACPSSYTVSMPNGASAAVYLTFFTTETAVQTATLSVTGYGPCAGTTSMTMTYSASRPFTSSPISACATQYANVFPYLSNIACFDSPGIEMYKAYSSQDGPITPSSTVQYVSTQVDSAVTSMASMIANLLVLQSQLSYLPYTTSSGLQAAQQYDQILQQQLAIVASANYTQENANEAAQKRVVQQQISANSASVLGGILVQEQQAKKLQNLTIQANSSNTIAQQLNALSNNMTNQMLALVNLTTQEIAQEAAYVEQQLALAEGSRGGGGGGSCGGVLGSIFLIGSIICAIENAFSDLLSGIMSVIVIIIIIALIICCCPICISGARDCYTKIKSHKNKQQTNNVETSGEFKPMLTSGRPNHKKTKAPGRTRSVIEMSQLAEPSSVTF